MRSPFVQISDVFDSQRGPRSNADGDGRALQVGSVSQQHIILGLRLLSEVPSCRCPGLVLGTIESHNPFVVADNSPPPRMYRCRRRYSSR